MKVFEIKWTSQDEKEWITAESLIAAIKFYCSETSWDIQDFEDDDEIREVPQEEWSKIKVKNDDNEILTVMELMGKGPCLLAGTMHEYSS